MFQALQQIKKYISPLIFTLLLSGCSLYRPSLQQGNYITQAQLDQLQPNQSNFEVQQIMGSTAVTPVFHTNQWNYSYAYVDGQHRDQPLKFKTITLFFKHGKLVSYASKYWQPANLPKHSSK